jgi:hypothetical protein
MGHRRTIARPVIATAVPVALIIFYVWASHRYGLRPNASVFWSVVIILLSGGAFLLSREPGRPLTKLLVIAVWLLVMVAALFASALSAACSFGDCL